MLSWKAHSRINFMSADLPRLRRSFLRRLVDIIYIVEKKGSFGSVALEVNIAQTKVKEKSNFCEAIIQLLSFWSHCMKSWMILSLNAVQKASADNRQASQPSSSKSR
ncbi:MAG: hypothetical protein EOP38_00340 [Rubrivivax sp.]|nr:MAG: hypothetical protein EOP38_00340 [Rubrivivax sp.]